MSRDTKPKWILTEQYGVGIDPLNWRLYHRTYNKKTGVPSGWKCNSYFPTLNMLITGLLNEMMLTDKATQDIPEHIRLTVEACREAGEALNYIMLTLGVGLNTYPPKYASYDILPTKENKK